jgi:hypothetical protein
LFLLGQALRILTIVRAAFCYHLWVGLLLCSSLASWQPSSAQSQNDSLQAAVVRSRAAQNSRLEIELSLEQAKKKKLKTKN